MPSLILRSLTIGFILVSLGACIDPIQVASLNTADVVIVDGLLTNLAEPQLIYLNRSRPDSITGRLSFVALTNATVEVVVDSVQAISCHETTDGRYQLPADFRGFIGHTYQLQFTLANGTHYQSTPQLMPPVTPIDKVTLHFSPTSLSPNRFIENYRAGFDVLVDTQDPASQQNYYRWDWKLYEKQDWCQSCSQGYYMPNQLRLVSSYPNILIYQTQPERLEDCFAAPADGLFGGYHEPTPFALRNDYVCRSQCWDIINSSNLSLFSDATSNGGPILGRNVGQVPYYTQNPALVEVRQSGLTADAYRYFKRLQEQTQNTGGLADTPPTALVGNVRNVGRKGEAVVGYFTATAMATQRYWLDKKQATGPAYGSVYYDPADKIVKPVPGEQQLFFAFHRDLPHRESPLNFTLLGGVNRPPTSLCVASDSRTPFKPVGWRD